MYPFSSNSTNPSTSSSSSSSKLPFSLPSLPTHSPSLSQLSPPQLLLTSFLLGSSLTFIAIRVHKRYLRRYEGSAWVTPDVLRRRVWVRGVVTSVGDADNFRLYHTPGFGWRWPFRVRRVPSGQKDLKDKTLHIRMAGVDAPEGAHFGRPAQKYYDEALAWLKQRIGGKMIYCQLISKDQYGRLVAIPMQPPLLLPHILTPLFGAKHCISLEMLRAGWAVVYEQSGAEYGKWGKEKFLRVESDAKSARRGIWKDGVKLEETPSEYKRRHSATEESASGSASSSTSRKLASAKVGRRWLRWLGF